MKQREKKVIESSMNKIPIGGNEIRLDAFDKVTGKTKYVEDIVLPDMCYAVVLRSRHHHARLLSLNFQPALGNPGIVRVLTAEDIPGKNDLSGYSQDEPVLTPVGETLKQRGAPIALVIAETLDAALQSLELIQVEYEPLEYFFDAGNALKPDAPSIYPAGNLLSEFRLSHGDLQTAFQDSDIVLETEYQTVFLEHSALEREAALGYMEKGERLTVVCGTHEPHWQQGYIAQTIGIDPSHVRVIMPPTGGSFGGKQDPWPLVAVGLAAYLVGRPVRLTYSRREVFEATPKRHPYHLRFKIGSTREGRFTGIQVRIEANTGGYDSAGTYIPNYAVTSSGGAYAWTAVDAVAQSVYTNGPKCGQFRGFGTSQSTFAIECTLDELAQKLGIDPLEMRVQNIIQQGDKSFLGYPVGESLGFREVLEALRPHYAAFLEEMQEFNTRKDRNPQQMGVGMAGMWYRFGKSGSLKIEAHAELGLDGEIIVYCSAPDYGQGIETVMVQLAAEILGLPRERIQLVNADTSKTPDSGIQGASRATYFIGGAVCQATQNLKREILSVASEMLDVSPHTLVLKADGIHVSDRLSQVLRLDEIAAEFENLRKPRRILGTFDLNNQFPKTTRPEYIPLFVTGAQVAQVVVDFETGQARVSKIAAAQDVGKVINSQGATVQVQGAILMGIGAALTEEYIPGETTGFADYILPMVDFLPEMKIELVEVPSYFGPHGAKGLGEAAMLPTTPAVINAISRAIGVRIRRIPATPERILEAMQAKGRS